MRPRTLIATAAIAALLCTVATAAPADVTAAKRGATWLRGQSIDTAGQQADAIVALAAVGTPKATLRSRLSALAVSAPGYATGAGSAGKIVLAAVAAGANPRAVSGIDYVQRVRGTYRSGYYGSGTYDQAYAVLALRAAGERVPIMALRRLTGARGAGGWGYRLSRNVPDDVSATGLVIQALRSAGLSTSHGGLRAATAWMLAQRNRAGGYAIDGRRRATEANATAIAISALRAMGRSRPGGAYRSLRRLQESDGGFRFTRVSRGSRLLATLDAVVALAGRNLPVR